MTTDLWRDVDDLLVGRLLPGGADPSAIVDAAAAALGVALPPHEVSPLQGRLLEVLVRLAGARRVLELGTLGGVSAVWMARALPATGELVTIEVEPERAEVAREALRAAGLADRVCVIAGDAAAVLGDLAAVDDGPFDLVFLDADKASSSAYLDLVLPLVRVGAVLVADNVVRGGAVLDVASADATAQGVRSLLARLEGEPRIAATALQTVGAKGHDGLIIAVVTS